MITFGSLFAGIGGFDIGFERAGMRCEWQVEIDEFCQRVLAKHWPTVGRWDDVHTFPPVPAEDWRVDIICGGDPCQRNSAAGNSSKPSLGGEFVRVVDVLRPRIVVRENPTHTRADAPWPWWRMRTALESIAAVPRKRDLLAVFFRPASNAAPIAPATSLNGCTRMSHCRTFRDAATTASLLATPPWNTT